MKIRQIQNLLFQTSTHENLQVKHNKLQNQSYHQFFIIFVHPVLFTKTKIEHIIIFLVGKILFSHINISSSSIKYDITTQPNALVGKISLVCTNLAICYPSPIITVVFSISRRNWIGCSNSCRNCPCSSKGNYY